MAYASMATLGAVTDRPAADHGDLNVRLRGWEPTGGLLGLVDYGGGTDELAPHLNTMFADDQRPAFVANYAVRDWDWSCNCPGDPITTWEVTALEVQTDPGQVLELPRSGYDIGGGHQARVLHVDDESITLKYTLEDNVVFGYTVHLVGLCVEPSLRARYEADDGAGRAVLPALGADEPLGRARGTAVVVVIRDTGSFMDPRSDKDWWDL